MTKFLYTSVVYYFLEHSVDINFLFSGRLFIATVSSGIQKLLERPKQLPKCQQMSLFAEKLYSRQRCADTIF